MKRSGIKKSLVFYLLIFASSLLPAQPGNIFKIGLSTNANTPFGNYVSNPHIYAAFPGIPAPLTINTKIKRHEIVAGADFYHLFVPAKRRIIGLDASYRYHFYKPGKKRNLYLDLSAYYVQFAAGTGDFVNYHYSTIASNSEAASVYKIQTPAASTGIGIELPFLKYFTFFSSVGFGFIYVHSELDPTNDKFPSEPKLPDSFIPTANVVLGLAVYFYTRPEDKKSLN